MASNRSSFQLKTQPLTSTSKSSKVGAESAKGNNSGASKKTKSSGTEVMSRYLQPVVDKTLSKNLLTESEVVRPRPASPKPGGVKPRFGTPPRRSMAPQSLSTQMMPSLLEATQLGKTVMQSTILDGHHNRPDFDLSVIKDKTMIQSTAEPERCVENDKSDIEMQTFLLTYLTAKMEQNTRKLKAEAEGRILALMEEDEQLRLQVQEKQRQHLLLERRKQMNDLLDLQIAALTPVVDAAQQFTDDYKSFATAVDTTRHELPVKNLHIQGDRREFLNKAEECLKESEQVLQQCIQGDQQDNHVSAECLRGLKTGVQDISEQLSAGFSELSELSSLVSRQAVVIQQSLEEEQLGFARAQELYCPKT